MSAVVTGPSAPVQMPSAYLSAGPREASRVLGASLRATERRRRVWQHLAAGPGGCVRQWDPVAVRGTEAAAHARHGPLAYCCPLLRACGPRRPPPWPVVSVMYTDTPLVAPTFSTARREPVVMYRSAPCCTLRGPLMPLVTCHQPPCTQRGCRAHRRAPGLPGQSAGQPGPPRRDGPHHLQPLAR